MQVAILLERALSSLLGELDKCALSVEEVASLFELRSVELTG